MTLRSYQAITTKYLPPTNVKGSRVKATATAGSLTLHWDHDLNIEQNHAAAAEALAHRYNWRGNWFMGGLPNDAGYCFVCADNFETLAFTTFEDPAYASSGRDGTSGQDRESYSDDQDRDSYDCA